MKKIICLLLVFAVLSSVLVVSALAAPIPVANSISPRYLNVSKASIAIAVANSNTLSILPTCTGYLGTTSITARTHLELKVGQSWVTIANGQPNNEWTGSTNSCHFSEAYEYELQAPGTYRAVTIFTVTKGTSEGIAVFSNEISYFPYN